MKDHDPLMMVQRFPVFEWKDYAAYTLCCVLSFINQIHRFKK